MLRTAVEGLYEAAGQLARAAASVAPDTESKLGRTLHARRGVRARYAAWAQRGRARDRPLLWMHAPSVGEGLQARPVLEIIRRIRPDIQLAYTHFSPSAERFAASLDVDFHDYLPFDTSGDAVAALTALRPDALVFSKLDLWPTLTRRATSMGTRVGLISATVAPGSARYRNPVRWLMRPAYHQLDLVGAIGQDHASRLLQMGVRREVIRITGDTRYDQVWARAGSVDRTAPLLSGLRSERPTVVAGSTWPGDEAVLLPAWAEVLRRVPGARLVIAPHEPTSEHLAALETALDTLSGTRIRLTKRTSEDFDILVVDRLGVLGELYAVATAAYVGGGFHSAGLHSVLEPAAYGAPVLFGPAFANSQDAVNLTASGGGASARTVSEMAELLVRWLTDADAHGAASNSAKSAVQQGLGAAQRSADIVLALLDRSATWRRVPE